MPTDHDSLREHHTLSGYPLAELRALVQDGIDGGPATPFDPESINHESPRLLKARPVEARPLKARPLKARRD